ncbi:MAG TPA: hypothetical protein VN325_26855 [Steroidobacteraceae bacterium]|nr:hypothetical protein [Steroidobacteraceae bacterium]
MPRRTPLYFAFALFTATVAMSATYPTPMPSGFSPTSGPPGTIITVPGTGFTGLTQVWIGAAHDASVHVVSDTLVKVTVPNDATTAHLGFINPQNSHFTSVLFTVTKATTPAPTPVPTPVPTAGSTTISGAVTGSTGASVVLTGQSTKIAAVSSSGGYTFAGVANGTYTVAPSVAGHVFTPSSVAAKVAGAPVSNVNFSGTATSAPTYKISGTMVGTATSGVTMTLNGANIGSTVTDLGGNYSFSGLSKGTYNVSAALPGHSFSYTRLLTLVNVDSTGNSFVSKVAPSAAIVVTAINPLPQATVGRSYSTNVLKTVAGGEGTYHYLTGTYTTGTPPLGMILNNNGLLSGAPQKAGKYSFQLCAADAFGNVAATCAATTIVVAASGTTPAPAPAPAPTPTPTPTPVAGTSWVYYNGVFDWPGDYSFVASPNYADTSGAPLSGPHDIKVTLTSAWGGWLPYAKNWSFNSNGYTKLTFALKPTVVNQKWNLYFVKVGDIPVGISVDPSKYGPAPVVGKWATYTVPLSDLGVLGTMIYKFCIQDQTGLSNVAWYVDNVGFEP